MQVGIIGLGRMGAPMAERLLAGGHQVVVYNRSPEPVQHLASLGAVPSHSLEELVGKLKRPRVVWSMLPAGEVTDGVWRLLTPLLETGDILIDGGNARYQSSRERAEVLAERGLRFLDVGVSGGIWGLKEGYGLMVGGDEASYRVIEPLLETLAPPGGYAHLGPAGAGHFAKMVHNGIEYAMLEAYAEGFEILRASTYSFDLTEVAGIWNHGTVIRSWLLELAERAFKADPDLTQIRGYVADTGEGRWTVQEALALDVPATTIAIALFNRFRSRQDESFGAKVIAALRREFGGHAVQEESGHGPG